METHNAVDTYEAVAGGIGLGEAAGRRVERERLAHREISILGAGYRLGDQTVVEALRAGAAGYLLKGTPRAALIAAVKGTADGETHLDPKVAGKLLQHVSRPVEAAEASTLLARLSDRELDVLKLLAQGLSNADIAQRLYLSYGTVRNYVSAILTKLEVDDRTQAALLALRYDLIK
mgnify:CR=1 FL=1